MRLAFLYFFLICILTNCKGQKTYGNEKLALVRGMNMPSVKSRIDHMAVNALSKVIYVASLGKSRIEVIDLNKGVAIQSIKGVQEPQGIAYLPEQNEIAVASEYSRTVY